MEIHHGDIEFLRLWNTVRNHHLAYGYLSGPAYWSTKLREQENSHSMEVGTYTPSS